MSAVKSIVVRHRPDKHAIELVPGECRYRTIKLPCGHLVNILAHSIDSSGRVTPSVVCSNSPKCDGHYDVKISGWK